MGVAEFARIQLLVGHLNSGEFSYVSALTSPHPPKGIYLRPLERPGAASGRANSSYSVVRVRKICTIGLLCDDFRLGQRAGPCFVAVPGFLRPIFLGREDGEDGKKDLMSEAALGSGPRDIP